jgi:beta-lactamase regulating signal transducer with metallopeptidase domain
MIYPAMIYPAMIYPAMTHPAMTAVFNLNAIAQSSALQIVDCLVGGTLIAIFAALVLSVAGRKTSDTRFAVWFAALLAIAALPLFGGSWSHAGSIPATNASRSAITLPSSWALYVFEAWAAIAVCSLIQVGRGFWHLRVLRKSCIPVDPAVLHPQLQKTLMSRATRHVVVCTSGEVRVPTAIGFVRPAIVVPAWVMQELSSDELNQILLHELAHLRRWDDWTNLAQKVVKALFFFHPAVWWIEKRVSLEREMACDDAVIAETASPRAYAECLAHLAEKTLLQRSVALAQAALGKVRQTSLRVAQILDMNRTTRTGRGRKGAVSLVAGFAMVCVLSISRAPRLIAFRDKEPTFVARSTIASSTASSTIATFSLNSGSAHVSTTADVRASKAAFQPQPVRAVPTSLNAQADRHSLENRGLENRGSGNLERAAVTQPSVGQRANSMVRQAKVRLTNSDVAPVIFTETLFVVIEGSENGVPDQAVYQIQMWRVMVLHPVADPNSSRIPRKET